MLKYARLDICSCLEDMHLWIIFPSYLILILILFLISCLLMSIECTYNKGSTYLILEVFFYFYQYIVCSTGREFDEINAQRVQYGNCITVLSLLLHYRTVDMMWYDMICQVMIWYDVIWYDVICYVMICHVMIWHDMTWYGMICYDMI